MKIEEIMSQLNNISKTKYYKFVYKSVGECKICSQYDGKTFPDTKIPKTHPNCKCMEVTTDPIDIAMAKFLPGIEYFVGTQNFNQNRSQLEKDYGDDIDNGTHSAPQYKLADNIKYNGYELALYNHIAFREGKYSVPYEDSQKIPTVGVGANMTEEYIIKELLNMQVISQNIATILRNFHRLDKDAKEKVNNYLKKRIRLTEAQIQQLFSKSLVIAEKDAQRVLSKGKWISQKNAQGKFYMLWHDNIIDNTTWEKMPALVKAICVDLAFNVGGNKFAKYKNFIKAVKAEDYRRAGLELLNSKDYDENITKKGEQVTLNGLAKRRLDAAIELTKLAEEIQ